MLRLKLEMIPRGNESATREILTVEIVNDQTGTLELGNYRVAARGFLRADARIDGHPRRSSAGSLVAVALGKLFMAKCVSCEATTPEDTARSAGWHWGTMGDGNPNWLCSECWKYAP